MDTSDTDVMNGFHFIAHDFGGDLRLLGDKDIAGAGADNGDLALAAEGFVAPETDGA